MATKRGSKRKTLSDVSVVEPAKGVEITYGRDDAGNWLATLRTDWPYDTETWTRAFASRAEVEAWMKRLAEADGASWYGAIRSNAKRKRTSREPSVDTLPRTSGGALDLRRLTVGFAVTPGLVDELRREVRRVRGRLHRGEILGPNRTERQLLHKRLMALHSAWERLGIHGSASDDAP